MRRTFPLSALAGLATLPFAGAAAAEPLKVVASFSIIGDMAKNVGGDRVDITTLVGPDGDAHVYEPRPADAVTMASADVVLVNGLHFEGFLNRLVEESGTKAAFIELTRGVDAIRMKDDHETEGAHDDSHSHKEDGPEAGEADAAQSGDHAHEHGGIDPHAFQSVDNARIYVANIADAFCAADASGCPSYKANAVAYTATLDALDEEIRAKVAAIPESKRVIITSHDAFGYFEHAYGFTFLAPEGISTEAQASAADVAALIRQIREDRASALFVENITNRRLVEQISSETGLKLGGILYSDALSGSDGPASTYVYMMRHNIATIAGAVAGS